MAKQAKPKASVNDNPDRPNGKAWKQSHGSTPPLEKAQEQSAAARRRNAKASTKKKRK